MYDLSGSGINDHDLYFSLNILAESESQKPCFSPNLLLWMVLKYWAITTHHCVLTVTAYDVIGVNAPPSDFINLFLPIFNSSKLTAMTSVS